MPSTSPSLPFPCTLLTFDALPDAVILAARKVNASTDKATASLGSKGVTYEDGTIKVKTSMAPVSREQQVKASAEAANAAARHVLDHKEAFSVGGGDAAASASGVDT